MPAPSLTLPFYRLAVFIHAMLLLAPFLFMAFLTAGGVRWWEGQATLALLLLATLAVAGAILFYWRIIPVIARIEGTTADLRTERDFADAVLQTAGNIIVILDRQGHIVRFNQAAEALTGYRFAELRNQPVWDYLIPPEQQDDVRKVFDRLMLDDIIGSYENDWLTKSGSRCPLDWRNTVLRDKDGQVSHVVALGYDLTERREKEIRLRHNEATLAQVQAQARLGSWSLDIPGNMLTWSDECYRIFGVPPGTPLTYESFIAAVHPDDRTWVDARWRAAAHGEPYDIQHRLLVDGQVRWVRERADLEFHPDGTLWRSVGTTQDITELKQKEDELLRSRQQLRDLAAHHEQIREEERTRIAREVHDELGQYLTALRMDTALLRIHFGRDNPELQQQVEGMKQTIDTTIGVVRNVVTALRPAALDMGLISAAEWLLAGFKERTGIPCQIDAPRQNLGLNGAQTTAAFRILQECLTNITRHAGASQVKVVMHRNAQIFTMRIADDGVGFNPYKIRQRKTFGLMGIRERAIAFGGTVKIVSRPGHGTTVYLTIPLSPESTA